MFLQKYFCKRILMTYESSPIEELKDKSLKEILQSVLADRKALAIQLPDGAKVVIQPGPKLKPLPTLDGQIPDEWKEAIYMDSWSAEAMKYESGSRPNDPIHQ